ncbi:hypothetical protein MMC24_001688 [Lignoscripta atroalba]|nr:hypothetical protein [Lignoscripta atroalba]
MHDTDCTSIYTKKPRSLSQICQVHHAVEGEVEVGGSIFCTSSTDTLADTESPITPPKPTSQLKFSTPFYFANPIHCQLPPTPEQTPTKGIKRTSPSDAEEASDVRPSKRLDLGRAPRPSKSPFRRNSIPRFSILNRKSTDPPKLSADELKRASEAVLRQIDWEEVEEYVASNRGANVYRRAIKRVLQDEVDELFEAENSLGCLVKEALGEVDY